MNNCEFSENYYKNALVLAYMGDSVFSTMVREHLVNKYDLKPNGLNKKANSVVCAKAQAEIMNLILPTLKQDELDVVMRARNSHLNSKAKNSTLHEYSLATQFEALVGYWYLNAEHEKLNEMFEKYIAERL